MAGNFLASSAEALLKDIEHKIFLGKYNDALNIYKELSEKEGLSKTELLYLNLYKSDIISRKGEYQDGPSVNYFRTEWIVYIKYQPDQSLYRGDHPLQQGDCRG